MEQAWTIDKYDVPRGDLEFWAMRRGMIESAGRNAACTAESRRGATVMRRLVIVAVLGYAVALSLQACIAPLG